MEENKIISDQINIDKAWDCLHNRLEKEDLIPVRNVESEKKIRRLKLFVRSIAAIIILLMISSIAIHFISRKNTSQMMFVENQDKNNTLVKTLNDGTTVFLEPDALLNFPEKFASGFRLVDFKGDALFSVKKDSKRPFMIRAENVIIEVVGTTFNVRSFTGDTFELSVKEGCVAVTYKKNAEHILVYAGETVLLNHDKLEKKQTPDNEKFTTYVQNMRFKDESLDNIVKVINLISDKKIVFSDESLKNRMLTVTFNNDNTQSMVELICMALNLKQTTSGDTILISQ